MEGEWGGSGTIFEPISVVRSLKNLRRRKGCSESLLILIGRFKKNYSSAPSARTKMKSQGNKRSYFLITTIWWARVANNAKKKAQTINFLIFTQKIKFWCWRAATFFRHTIKVHRGEKREEDWKRVLRSFHYRWSNLRWARVNWGDSGMEHEKHDVRARRRERWEGGEDLWTFIFIGGMSLSLRRILRFDFDPATFTAAQWDSVRSCEL